MTTPLVPYALGASGQTLSGRTLRLALGAAFTPSSSGGVVGVSGVLHGPPGTMGELALPSNASVTVQPFRAVIQNTQDLAAGQYVIPNEAARTLAVPAQDATQFRRALISVRVADSQIAGVPSSPTTDGAWLEIQSGALASTAVAAALPATTPNTINLGELLIPPTGQTVTLTPYNPRTTARGGILPMIDDASTVSGHAGRAGTFDGMYRDRAAGLERWSTTRTRWEPPRFVAPRLRVAATAVTAVSSQEAKLTAWSTVPTWDTHGIWTGATKQVQIPADWGGMWKVGYVGYVTGTTPGKHWADAIIFGTPPATGTMPTNHYVRDPHYLWSTYTKVGCLYEGPISGGQLLTPWFFHDSTLAPDWAASYRGAPAYLFAEWLGPLGSDAP